MPTRTVYVPPSRQPVAGYANPAPVIYQTPYPQQYPPQSIAASFFGKLTTGQVVDMVAQLFAALQPLPGAPVATRDTATDVGNLIILCRARHNKIYADRRIMPRASGRLDEVGARQGGIIRARFSLRRVAAG